MGTSAQRRDPSSRFGRRERLEDQLLAINYGGETSIEFEIVASKQMKQNCFLYGVIHVDGDQDAANETLLYFLDKQQEIRLAVIEAFEFGDFPDLKFEIEISSNFSPRIKELVHSDDSMSGPAGSQVECLRFVTVTVV